jgi:anti-sigma factor RsiW
LTHPGEHITDETLSVFIDDRLTPDEERAVRAHLETCSTCQAHVDELESVVALLRALPSVETPRTFALGPRLISDPPNVLRLRRWYTITRVGAASLAAVFVFLSVGSLYLGAQPTPSSVGLYAKAQPASSPQSAQAPSTEAVAPVPAATSAPARQAAPAPAMGGAARSAQAGPTPTGAGDAADLTTAATSVRPLPTPVPTPAVRAASPAPSAASGPSADQLDPAGSLGIAAALVGVLAVLGVLAALIVRHRLQAASGNRLME